MVRRSTADCVIRTDAKLAESPVWDPRHDLLVWADIASGVVWRSDVATGDSEMHSLHDRVGCIAPCGRRGYLIAGGARISIMDSFGEDRRSVAVACHDRRVKLNDGAVDPRGQFWVGSASIAGDEGLGALFCLNAEGKLNQVLSNVTTSNGMDWSPKGETFYHVDTAKGGIDAYDAQLETAALSNRRRLVEVPPDLGLADGLTVDIDGCIWLAVWFLGEIRRYSPTGKLLEIVSVPASLTTSCTFGGRHLRTLYITTARGLSRDGRGIGELAGSIFAVETNTAGQPRPPYCDAFP